VRFSPSPKICNLCLTAHPPLFHHNVGLPRVCEAWTLSSPSLYGFSAYLFFEFCLYFRGHSPVTFGCLSFSTPHAALLQETFLQALPRSSVPLLLRVAALPFVLGVVFSPRSARRVSLACVILVARRSFYLQGPEIRPAFFGFVLPPILRTRDIRCGPRSLRQGPCSFSPLLDIAPIALLAIRSFRCSRPLEPGSSPS